MRSPVSVAELARQDGLWWQPGGWQAARCRFDSHVHSFTPLAPKKYAGNDHLPMFVPAPVDLHVHGGGGADVMHGEIALRRVLRTHGAHGTGALLATSVTATDEAIEQFLDDVRAVMEAPEAGEAELLGAHLEGPFINPDKLGAQPPFARRVDPARLARWLETGVVRVVTYAPEMDPEEALPALCQKHNARVQLGHSLCDWAKACREIAAGAGVTHLYNAMSGFSHREGGLALAALAVAEQAEIIVDGVHVDAAAFRAAERAIPGLYGVTDATAAAGMPDGRYRLGSIEVEKCGNHVRLDDGTLAGSCLTAADAVGVLRSWHVDWHRIGALLAGRPSHWVNAVGHGLIRKGAAASWLEISDDQVVASWLRGERRPWQAHRPVL